jgi:hypothetical protein
VRFIRSSPRRRTVSQFFDGKDDSAILPLLCLKVRENLKTRRTAKPFFGFGEIHQNLADEKGNSVVLRVVAGPFDIQI